MKVLLALDAREKTIKLRSARAQLGLTQGELGTLADVHPNIISRCERGIGTISPISAWAILTTLNAERAKRNWPELTYEEMEWKVQGEK